MKQSWSLPAPELGRDLGLARWGHYGKPVILFPTGGADHLDVERFLLVRALQPLVDAGRIKLYSVDSVCRQGWLADTEPREKVRQQAAYAAWLEAVCFATVREDCGGTDQPFAVAGASLGAFQAWSAAARHPGQIDLCVGMSGTYSMDRRLGGYWDKDWYHQDPRQFVGNAPEGPEMERLRGSQFVFGLGENYENVAYTDEAAAVLDRRRVPVTVLRWRAPAGHDWPTWRTMLPTVLEHFV